MRVLGIDPGLKITGYGCVDITGPDRGKLRLLEAGTIEPRVSDSMPDRILKIYDILSGIIDEQKPEVIVVEKIYSHNVHPMTAAKLGHVRGVVYLLSSQKKISLAELSPKRARQSITGNGNASKQQVLQVISNFFDLKADQLTLDASDALAMALGYIHISGRQGGFGL
jgi:crossover junction endodeoxyribonuclease RuvC